MNRIGHSPEPWKLAELDELTIRDCERELVGILDGLWDQELAAANSRRIVACINAFAGVPTEAIEKLATDAEGFVAALMAGRAPS